MGIDTRLIFNMFVPFIVLLIVLSFLFLLTILKFYANFDENGLVAIIYKKLRCAFLARFVEFTALPLSFFAWLELMSHDFIEKKQAEHVILAVITLVFLGIWMVLLLKFLVFNENEINWLIYSNYVFVELMDKSKTIRRMFPAVKLAFNILLALGLVFFIQNFRKQLAYGIIFFIIKGIFIAFVKPYKESVVNHIVFLNSSLLFLLYSMLYLISFQLNWIRTLENIAVFILEIGILINLLFIFLHTVLPNKHDLYTNLKKVLVCSCFFGVKMKKNKNFIQFAEKQSQNTKEVINSQQKQYNEFFKNPSPEISENSQEIAKIALENYVQTDVRDNEKFENRENKKKIVKIVSQSVTNRENQQNLELSFTQRQKLREKIKKAENLKKNNTERPVYENVFNK